MATASHRLDPDIIDEDVDAYNNLVTFTDYHPINAKYALSIGFTTRSAFDTTRAAEDVAKKAYDAARDAAAAAEQALHDYIIGARTQVEAQYGPDSDQLQSLGIKKKSERKKSTGRTPKPKQ